MKKVLFASSLVLSTLFFASSSFAEEGKSYLGYKLVGLNESCDFDIDCESEWCKPDSNADGAPKHCAAKLADNSPCTDHRECQNYHCVLPDGGSQKQCVPVAKLVHLNEPCTKHEDCASGRCQEIDGEKICIMKLRGGDSCAGDLQNLCRQFYKCDPSTSTCVGDTNRGVGETCTLDHYCESNNCERPKPPEEGFNYIDLVEGQCAEPYDNGHSCVQNTHCKSGLCAKKSSGTSCTDDPDAARCCAPKS